ncbi:hypothetical protein AAFF_G00101520 [Aldrovandia affinis]|uniref:Reverse transcriptase zinc-binding domain-containing protein n=1 Tax=Aldrovandia affinis TaxID=143900 RepID=A0AAD7VX83_9TELE|nr:hypothetical protein AAFF_G00101520 [Aldrovandia affinis]
MLTVAESYYAELFRRRACDPAAEARLLDCVSARLGSEEAQAMEADVTLEEVRRAVFSTRGGRAPGHDGLPGEFYIAFWHLLGLTYWSCVRVNGFLSGPVGQLGGVRQGCPLSPLLYVLFMEPFAELVRRDPGVDGVRLPGAGVVLKIQHAAQNWEARLALVRSRLGVWSRRQLSLTGKVVVVRSVLLPLLLHLAYVFPVPARAKLALTRAVFRFLWGGSYEYVSRELMYAPVAGGRGVPRVPLKLDGLYASFASKIVLERAPHKCFFLARFFLAGFFRHLEALTHVVPRADVRSPAYEAVVRFFRQCPPSISRAEALDHRALYQRLAGRQVVAPTGVPAGVRWGRVSGGSAPAAVRDLHWRCALGRLPVREVLHRHGLSASALCPRGCGAPETVRHAFWGCPFAGEFWGLVLGLIRRVGPGFVLSGDGVVFRRGLGVVPAVSAGVLWDVLGFHVSHPPWHKTSCYIHVRSSTEIRAREDPYPLPLLLLLSLLLSRILLQAQMLFPLLFRLLFRFRRAA